MRKRESEPKGGIHGERRRPFRRARISSRALDLITKIMRCLTTPLKGIKSYRSTSPLVACCGNIAAINASSVTAMIWIRLQLSVLRSRQKFSFLITFNVVNQRLNLAQTKKNPLLDFHIYATIM